jgi:hypothetical protein
MPRRLPKEKKFTPHREPGSGDEDHGAGMGYVDIFDINGKLLRRFEHGSFLNAP